MSPLLTVSVERVPGQEIVRAWGEVDLGSVSVLADAMDAVIDRGSQAATVVVDLTEVTFMASAGLSAVVEANQRARMAGLSLVVVSPQGSAPRRAFSVSAVDRVLVLAEDLTSASSHRR
ncbi:STAS domain-containing protein [Actinokineospora terrae]|uniref:Anti-anti-sigma factor n=1 Tax=Actinokineospora terrae TaxID=155974 RepID=A0A1H9T2C4_9PSEU|nr:STAS domain-containing protein [Actinokineospora terrae]SER91298.1 anti-anti-sigma factor [Actinokineospora terrae]